jgi:hypothetical protein
MCPGRVLSGPCPSKGPLRPLSRGERQAVEGVRIAAGAGVVGSGALLAVAGSGVDGGSAAHRAAVDQCLRRLSLSSHLAVVERVITVLVAELAM